MSSVATRLRRNQAGRWPTGLLGMLLAVAAVEGAVLARGDAFRDWMGFTWSEADRAAAGPAARADVLVLGDSLLKHGVLPSVLRRESGLSAYNLAVHGGSAASSDALLAATLRAGGRPKFVLVDLHPNLLASAPRSTSPSCWAEVLGPAGAVDLGIRARDPQLMVRTLIARLLPSVRLRDGLRGSAVAALGGPDRTDRALCRALGRNFEVNAGARVTPVQPPPANLAELLRNLPERGPWKPHRANLAFFDRLIRRAEGAHAQVVWVWPPTTPEWQGRRVEIGADPRYEKTVKTVLAAHPGVLVVDGRRAGYDHSAFYDLTHMHARGAAALSAGLAAVLTGPDAHRGGWVDLPPYRPAQTDPPAEDLDRSRIAVGSSRPVRLR